MNKFYSTAQPNSRGNRTTQGERIIDTAKAAVPVIDLADRLCGAGGLRRAGKEWIARCPLPDHEDRSPSFTVNPEVNLWFCHGCLRGGDVVRLAALAWGYEPRTRDEAMAAADLLHEFGHEIPERPPAWAAKQQRQREARAAFSRVRVGACQRRVYELLRRDQEALGNANPTRAEREYLWDGAGTIASLLVGDRMNSRERSGSPGSASAPLAAPRLRALRGGKGSHDDF